MTSLILALIGVAMLALCGLALRLWTRVGSIALLLAAILVGLAYDNLAMAIGRFVGYGDVLLALNVPRFWIHAIATPLVIIVAGNLVERLGVGQIHGRNITLGGWALVAMLILIGIVEAARAQLVPENAGDALRYTDAATSGPPLPAIITVLAVIVVGVMAFRYAGFPWLFFGGLVMLVAAAVGGVVFWIGNLGELVLMTSVMATLAAVAGYRVPSFASLGGIR
ncbi:hypothetical protein AAFP35_02305 [Gordonia sp. CPCC 206044]|uniref:hypothetical protein n=1 Tax=Gordonia sp. CPCC 206044 TaxID=3140793 RepID=UPI003AF37E38